LRAHHILVVSLVAVAIGAGFFPAWATAQSLEDPTREASCAALLAGTASTPKDQLPPRAPDALTPTLNDQAATPAAEDHAARLPERVDLRTSTESFNARYDFALLDGQIFVRERGSAEAWLRLNLPACFAGRVTAISADDEELIAVDPERSVYTMDYALGDVWTFNWTARWGPHFWANVGIELPADTAAWTLSNLTAKADGGWVDEAGNFNSSGGVTTVFVLREDRQRITYLDPWLPIDYSYEMCGPQRGTLRLSGISASGSTTFVAGMNGSLWTRLYDFDTSGANSIFVDYSYEDQRGLSDHRVQLPASPWVEHDPPPGRYTDLVSIEKIFREDKTDMTRRLRVEGAQDGATGFWEKDWRDDEWTFVPTGRELLGNPLPRAGQQTHGPAEDFRFTGTIGNTEVSVPNFNPYCGDSDLIVRSGTEELTLTLHSVDGLRQEQRARGLDDTAHEYYGVIEVPPSVLENLDDLDPELRAFVQNELGGMRYAPFAVSAFSDRIRLGSKIEVPCYELIRSGGIDDTYPHEPYPDTVKPRPPLDLGADLAAYSAAWDYGRTRWRC
jgi:hypothetical protein